jgi:DNA-binding LacI/PurR family transcriptional regulator
MGRQMARLVLSMTAVRGQSAKQVVLSPELAVRESTVSAR